MKIKTLLLMPLVLLLSSCQSTKITRATNATNQKNQLEEATIFSGLSEQRVWINRSIIVGTIDYTWTHVDSIYTVLKDLNLEREDSGIIRTDIGLPTYTYNFHFFKRADGQPISDHNSSELLKLRTRYRNNFGPGIYETSGKIWGILLNAITVKFEQDTDKKRIASLFASHQSVKFIEVRSNEYHVEFPKSWSYKILDITQQIKALDNVSYVENQLHVIQRPT